MKYENFETLITSYKDLWDSISELADMGFDLYGEAKYNLMSPIETMLFCQLNEFYTEEGVEWVTWFIFENEFGEKDWTNYKRFGNFSSDEDSKYGAFDEDGKPICYDLKSTWEYIDKNHKLDKNHE